MHKCLNKSSLIILYILIIVCSTTIVLASNSFSNITSIPFEYNILATVSEGTTIDTTAQSKLKFHLYEPMDKVFYNSKLVNIENNSFDIDISGLHGESTFTFTNISNEKVNFRYYLSNSDGLLENYRLVNGKNIDAYITTYKSIKIVYSTAEKENVQVLISYLDTLPEKLISNIDTIKMIPYDTSSKIAGVAKENMITLYNFSKYHEGTQKNIIFHEIAHTFANKLIAENIIDYNLSDYSKVVLLDNNSVSNYAQKFTMENGRPSEDFADSVAFYFINPNFSKTYPNRNLYISKLIYSN